MCVAARRSVDAAPGKQAQHRLALEVENLDLECMIRIIAIESLFSHIRKMDLAALLGYK